MIMTLTIEIPEHLVEEISENATLFRFSPEETVIDILNFYFLGPYDFKRKAFIQGRLLNGLYVTIKDADREDIYWA